MFGALAYYIGYLLILLTAASSMPAAWRRRETYRLDILALVTLLAIAPLRFQLGALGIGLLLAQPYVLLRLIHHFRDVPAAVRRGAVAAIALGTAVYIFWPRERHAVLASSVSAYVVAVQVYVAAAFAQEARRRTGVTAKRLGLATLATALFATEFVFGAIAPWLSGPWRLGGQVVELLRAAMLACFYLAFNTPRWLRAAWQRTEQARYLSLAAGLDAEERGQRTAQDLSAAAARAAGY